MHPLFMEMGNEFRIIIRTMTIAIRKIVIVVAMFSLIVSSVCLLFFKISFKIMLIHTYVKIVKNKNHL